MFCPRLPDGVDRRHAIRPNDVRCWVFVENTAQHGFPLRCLTLVDEFPRECRMLEVERSMSGDRVRDLLAEAIRSRGVPEPELLGLRSDNGSEFVATKPRQFLKATEIETLHFEPGSPWQNGYGGRFDGRLRDELLNAGTLRGPAGGEVPSLRVGKPRNHVCLGNHPTLITPD